MANRTFPLFSVDAFTGKPFSGNPAAVSLIASNVDISEDEMQKVGAEMNLSETAFVILEKGQDFSAAEEFNLRWFTPTTEVNLCGHATLASAAVLVNVIGNKSKQLTFHTKSGQLVVRSGDTPGFLSMQFPLNKPSPVEKTQFQKLLQVCVDDQSLIEEVLYSSTTKKLVIRLKDDVPRNYLEEQSPKISAMVEAEPSGMVRGVGLTIKGSHDNGCVNLDGKMYDFISRYFAPWVGIPEDPVTGSWHTVLTPYWAEQLNKDQLYARQVSPRGGDLWVSLEDTKVTLTGQATINLRGTFHL